jgi:hypothetical protein
MLDELHAAASEKEDTIEENKNIEKIVEEKNDNIGKNVESDFLEYFDATSKSEIMLNSLFKALLDEALIMLNQY